MIRIVVFSALLALSPRALALDPELAARARDPDSFKRSDAAQDLGREGSPKAAALLRDLLADPNPYVRDHAVKACGDLEAEKAVSVLAAAATDREELTRRNVAEALGRTRSPAALGTLARLAVKDRSPLVRVQALDWLWGYARSARALEICSEAHGDRDPRVRAAAVEAAGRIKGEGALSLVRQALADSDEGVRCVARMELRFLAAEEASARLLELAAAPGRRSRAQAVDDAMALRDVKAIEALLALVGDDVLSVACSAHRALRLLSGKEIGRDPDLWRSWWDAVKEDWKPPRGRLGGGGSGEDKGRSLARFHGLEVTSDRVAFLIDISGSMARPLPGDREGRTRWEAVQDELTETLAAMPDGARINLVVFGERPTMAFKTLAALTRRNRAKIVSFAKRSAPGGKGNLLAAVLAALDQEAADTIILLSDGAPSAGAMVDKARVRSTIRQTNRMRKVRIHTVGYGSEKETEKRFLEGLAQDSGGVSVFR